MLKYHDVGEPKETERINSSHIGSEGRKRPCIEYESG